jgi:hypothetical protein
LERELRSTPELIQECPKIRPPWFEQSFDHHLLVFEE